MSDQLCPNCGQWNGNHTKQCPRYSQEAADRIEALAALAHKRDCEATYERARADRLELLREADARRVAELEGSIVAARTDHLCSEKAYQWEKSRREKAERELAIAVEALDAMIVYTIQGQPGYRTHNGIAQAMPRKTERVVRKALAQVKGGRDNEKDTASTR